MKSPLLIIALAVSCTSFAQYYYHDIIGTANLNRQMKNYLIQKVRTVTSSGYDQRGSRAGNFSEYQEVKDNGLGLKTTTIAALNKTVVYSKYDNQSRITSMMDSSSSFVSDTRYEYDPEGRVSRISNTTRDSANDFTQTEVHIWMYNTSGKPEKMWRVINRTDSLEIRFSTDGSGNTADEKTFRRGVESGMIYYYYDDMGRLTDIVRYNNRAKRLLPDMMFEYDDQDRVIQKVTTTLNLDLGYLIWRYIFDEKGLKSKEALFNNEKQLTGKIEYSYTFGQ